MGRCQDPEWDDLMECEDLGAVIGYLGDSADARELLDAIEEQDADRALVVLRNMHGRFHDDWRRQGTPGGIGGRGSVPDGSVSTSGMAKLVRDDESGLFFLIPLAISAAKAANKVQRESRKAHRRGAPATAPVVTPAPAVAPAPAPATATATTSRMVVLVPGSRPAAPAPAPKSKPSASRAGVATAPPNVPPAPVTRGA